MREKKGKVWRFNDWGMRRLAYKIKKAKHAHYFLMNFELDAKWINDFKSLLDKDERVIRHLVVKRDEAIMKDCPPPPDFFTMRGYVDEDDEEEEEEYYYMEYEEGEYGEEEDDGGDEEGVSDEDDDSDIGDEDENGKMDETVTYGRKDKSNTLRHPSRKLKTEKLGR